MIATITSSESCRHTDLIAAGHEVFAQFFNDRCSLLWLYGVLVQGNNYGLRRLHAMDANFAEFCPYHTVRARQVDVPIAG